jgi:hypothetical protein
MLDRILTFAIAAAVAPHRLATQLTTLASGVDECVAAPPVGVFVEVADWRWVTLYLGTQGACQTH